MSTDHSQRLPISARHAFALAFDLALRRDALHSFLVPLLIRAPWSLTAAILPPLGSTDRPERVLAMTSAALVGDFVAMLVVGGMLRFRARSVFNTPAGTRPMPVLECYALGVARLPWLFLTEVMRNVAVSVAGLFLLLPGIFLGFKLSMATESTVLRDDGPFGAFRRSWHLTRKRFERWLEMIAMSVLLVLGIWFVVTGLFLAFPGPGVSTWIAIAWLLVAAFIPVIQYAWTFFYLRLEEIDTPIIEVGPAYAVLPDEEAPPGAAPHLTLVEAVRQDGDA